MTDDETKSEDRPVLGDIPRLNDHPLSDVWPERMLNAGVVFRGQVTTFRMSEAPNNPEAVPLSEILETDVPARYHLTVKQATNMLNRLRKYGRDDGPLGVALREYIERHT